MASSRRDALIDTALTLFARNGYHATGIDKILAEAGCAKMTLYNHFKSKDELILATLRRRDERFRDWFMRAVERRAATPRDQLLAIFDVLGEWFAEPDFSGCMFINASAEYGQADDPIHRAAAEHKQLIRSYVRDLSAKAGANDPNGLADSLMLLAEGAIVMAHVAGQANSADNARRAARLLIKEALI